MFFHMVAFRFTQQMPSFFFLIIANRFSWCRSISKVVQTGFVSCQSVQKFFACWADYAVCKLFSNFTSNVTSNPSASHVVEFEKRWLLGLLMFNWFIDWPICGSASFRDAWDMAAEICLSQLPALVEDPNLEFQVSFSSHVFLLYQRSDLGMWKCLYLKGNEPNFIYQWKL